MVKNLEEDFLLMMGSLNLENKIVEEKRRELGTFNFQIEETTQGLDLLVDIDNKNGETYYGFVFV